MKRIINLFLCFTPVILFYGCSKNWLDVKQNFNQTVASNLTDFQDLLNNSTAMNTGCLELSEIASDGHYVTESTFDNSSQTAAKNAYTWSQSVPYLNSSSPDWGTPYGRVFTDDLVLDGLSGITISSAADQQTWNNIKGQALFNRAEIFYELAQVYAPAFDSSTASTDLGIPLRLTSDITIPSVRSTVQQTYDQIINDLREAETLLPVSPLYLTQGSQRSVYALLSRIYLSMGAYDSAFAYANVTLKLYDSLLDFNTLAVGNSVIGLFNSEVLYHSVLFYSDYYSGFLTTNCLIDTILYQLYDTNDLRKVIYFAANGDGSFSFVGDYNEYSQLLFNGLATDEMYLIRAECYARSGDEVDAMADLNTLLQKRWKAGTFVPFTATSAFDALNQILVERRKELILRGTRWPDLRRLNKEPQFAITLSRTIGGQTYMLSPNTFEYTFPIPADIILITGMKQNPGW